MRDLLSLASEKGARRILGQMRRLDVAPPPDVIRERGMTDYDRELGEL
jgi:hypothetical protein